MIFYYAPKTVSLASHVALEEAGASYDAQQLDFSVTEQRSKDYLKINPKGRVPALAVDQGIITETPAILAYIAQTFTEARLAPTDAFGFAKMQEFNAYLCATVHVAHAHRVRGSRWVDDEAAIKAMQAKVPETMAECFQLIEDEMFEGPWVLGDSFSVCDCYLFTISNWLESDSVDLNKFSKVADHFHRMQQRDAVQKVLPLHRL